MGESSVLKSSQWELQNFQLEKKLSKANRKEQLGNEEKW